MTRSFFISLSTSPASVASPGTSSLVATQTLASGSQKAFTMYGRLFIRVVSLSPPTRAGCQRNLELTLDAFELLMHLRYSN